MDEEQEHDDDERQATGKVDVVELLCEGGRVDPDEQEEEENDDSATCVFPESAHPNFQNTRWTKMSSD